MDLKCLLKLLLEKEIIEDITEKCLGNNAWENEFGETMFRIYKFEYKEVGNKIAESVSEVQDNVLMKEVSSGRYNNKIEIAIINKQNVLNNILARNRGEKFNYYTHWPISSFKLKDCIVEDDRIEIEHIASNHYEITRIDIKEERERKENKRKNEVLDFINQLP